jgi:hypothetical protein
MQGPCYQHTVLQSSICSLRTRLPDLQCLQSFRDSVVVTSLLKRLPLAVCLDV